MSFDAVQKISLLKPELEESRRRIGRLEAQVQMLVSELHLTRERLMKVEIENAHLRTENQRLRVHNEGLKQEVDRLRRDPQRKQYEKLQALLQEQDCLYADETGWRQNGDNFQLWSFSSPEISFYRIDCRRQKCWAHFLREVHEIKKDLPEHPQA